MNDELLDTVATNPKVMPHIECPNQAGDDEVLANMHRGYTAEEYRRLVERIRARMPNVSIATDIIVGFSGESEAQFQHTYDLLAELKLDVAHLARYSPRPGTVSARRMPDDVSEEEKWRRFRLLEDLQEGIASEIHARYLGQTVAVLFEEQVKERWKGRTPTNKLVFAPAQEDLRGQVRPVKIDWTGPWSMIGTSYNSKISPASRGIFLNYTGQTYEENLLGWDDCGDRGGERRVAYWLLRRWSGNPLRDQRVLQWINDPQAHPDWAVQVGQRCGEAPFQLPTSGFIGYLWGDSFRSATVTRASTSSAGRSPGRSRFARPRRLPDPPAGLEIVADRARPARPAAAGAPDLDLLHPHGRPGRQPADRPRFPPGTNEMYIKAEGTLLGHQGNFSGTPG